MNIQLVLSMIVYLFACYWPQRISVLAFGVQRMPDFVKQGLHSPRVHDGAAHGLSWKWFELTGAQWSELLKEKRKHKSAGRLLSPRWSVLGSSVPPPVSVQPGARQALTHPFHCKAGARC